MRTTFKVLAYALAVEVLVQSMAIAYATAGLGKFVDDGGVVNKALKDSDNPAFTGVGGFMIHGINGTMVIPLLVLVLLVVSLFAKVPGGTRRAGILVGLVVVQVFLGIFSHDLPAAIVLHVLNAFAIFLVALTTARGVGSPSAAPASVSPQATVSV